MMKTVSSPTHLFWASCVFMAYLADQRHAYDVDSINRFLQEAQSGRWRIYTSTIAIAEVRPSQIVKNVGSFTDFLEDLQGAVVLVDPDPNIMELASRLRDLPYQKTGSKNPLLSTPD